jgi:mono/diheme cytochrome c family protein
VAKRDGPPRFLFAAVLPLLGSLVWAAGERGAERGRTPGHVPEKPTATVGESWVRHLRISLENTTLGGIGRWGTSTPQPPVAAPAAKESLGASFALSGRDLYRLNCQACHREDGSGAPPEILPVTSLARATSRQYFRDKMKERGLPIDETQLAKNAADAEASLRKRIRSGGEKMPPFPQLDRAETDSLIAYVKQLSGVPEPGPAPPPIEEPVSRVGELLVKGTCHVCHDAAATPTTTFEYRVGYGEPPPLSFFTEQRTPAQVIRKVRDGLAEPSVSARHGRMPVFDYLTPEEVTAAYIYLLTEPPERGAAEFPGTAPTASAAAGGRPKL